MNSDVANKVVEKCLVKFARLSKKGKPKNSEWTVMAATYLIRKDDPAKIHIVSLATGTKCLDGTTRRGSVPGTLVHDSHAEVLARRGFIVWLLDQIKQSVIDKSEFVTKQSNDKYELSQEWQVGMMSTHLPCGDAAVFVKEVEEDDGEPDVKKSKLDLNRTGAKTLTDHNNPDPHLPGLGYHTVGCLRTKPGRGDTTLSLSCSDKFLKWNVLGLQGSLCSYLLSKNIFLDHFIVVGDVYNEDSLQRAFYNRANNSLVHQPQLYNVAAKFDYYKTDVRLDPCPDSVVWINNVGADGCHEALTEGHKQGWSAKKLDNPKSWSLLCQRNIAKQFQSVYDISDCTTYSELKSKSPQHKAKLDSSIDVMKIWPSKPLTSFQLPVIDQ